MPFDAVRLAKSLQSLETDGEYWSNGKKWEMMCDVWVEMLYYAASQCGWKEYAQQLRRGGELLTHVWLLMAHFGISEHFKISQGHARSTVVLAIFFSLFLAFLYLLENIFENHYEKHFLRIILFYEFLFFIFYFETKLYSKLQIFPIWFLSLNIFCM